MSSETRIVLWRWLDGCGLEHCRMHKPGAEWVLDGAVITWRGGPWRIEYEVRCDEAWRTRVVSVRAHAGLEHRAIALRVDERGRWMVAGEHRGGLERCLDVDLGFTPSTNTLPIRRLRLGVGQSESITAAWLEFPSLDVRAALQRYTRLDERTYRYESPSTGFAAELIVDGDGLVVSYPPGWERVDG